jgi:hypothetical protein
MESTVAESSSLIRDFFRFFQIEETPSDTGPLADGTADMLAISAGEIISPSPSTREGALTAFSIRELLFFREEKMSPTPLSTGAPMIASIYNTQKGCVLTGLQQIPLDQEGHKTHEYQTYEPIC